MQRNHKCFQRGFTLTELLTAVIIVTVLVVMAAPLYEKMVERSHLAEVRQVLNTLQTSKIFAMTQMEIDNYDTSDPKPTMDHLNLSFAETAAGATSFNTKHFLYSIKPTGTGANPNAVCAKRLHGDAAGTIFYYYRPEDPGVGGSEISTFLCLGEKCEPAYGLDDKSETVSVTCE